MESSITADSLASVAELASNPPMDPRNSYIRARDPLVLYIARVPGSKDVFLTPIRPREKTVTVEDVTSSLYYLHANGPKDRALSSPNAIPEEREIDESRPPPPPPHRIPVSLIPQFPQEKRHSAPYIKPLSPIGDENWLAPKASSVGDISLPNGPTTTIRRKPVAKSSNSLPIFPDGVSQYGFTTGKIQSNGLPRKARPLSVRPDVANRHNVSAGRLQSNGLPRMPISPPYPVHDVFPNAEDYYPKALPPSPKTPELPWLSSYQSTESMSVKPIPPPSQSIITSLTLIRRDPSTGKQWNVANFSNPSSSGPYLSQRPVDITIENPGYSKFLPGQVNIDSASLFVPGQGNVKSPKLPPFQRELHMDTNRLLGVSTDHQRAKSHDGINFKNPFSSRSTLDVPRTDQLSSGSSVNLQADNPSSSSLGPFPKKDKRQTGYYFLSPWNGRCEFSSTIANTLKVKTLRIQYFKLKLTCVQCSHTLGPTALSSEKSSPVVVSELRFNLPANPTNPVDPSRSQLHINVEPTATPIPTDTPSSPIESRRTRFFGRLKKRLNSMDKNNVFSRRRSDPVIPPSNLNLSLGQERAGGGFSGKQAKMGKLIIEQEGLMMLDLLVAANMSLWWKAYGKESNGTAQGYASQVTIKHIDDDKQM
jgi:hypothetical protein